MARMKTTLKRFLTPEAQVSEGAQRVFDAALEPAENFIAIGDVHGRADLLRELDQLIEADFPDWPVVFLGDYVDRGDQSRAVLELLMTVDPEGRPPVQCLMGNHERMLLDFLDTPSQAGRSWLRNGGLQTLASFSVAPPKPNTGDGALVEVRDRLKAAMGPTMIDWLRQRPLTWKSGNVWAVHAGADPDIAMDHQDPKTVLWGHPHFHRKARSDDQWVVHGHTVVDRPKQECGRISVDTGAYATGLLTAAAISADGITYIQTGQR